jgi:hypothetical protein
MILNLSSTSLDSEHKGVQKTGFFNKIVLLFKVSAWLSHHTVCKIGLNK